MSPSLVPIQKLLRTPLAVLGVLTAPRLLRSPNTAIGVPRYVSGWELKIVRKLLRVPHLSTGASSVLTASRLLRAGAALKGPARYVSGWELKVVRELVSRLGSGLLVCGLLLHSGCLQDEVRALRRN